MFTRSLFKSYINYNVFHLDKLLSWSQRSNGWLHWSCNWHWINPWTFNRLIFIFHRRLSFHLQFLWLNIYCFQRIRQTHFWRQHWHRCFLSTKHKRPQLRQWLHQTRWRPKCWKLIHGRGWFQPSHRRREISINPRWWPLNYDK